MLYIVLDTKVDGILLIGCWIRLICIELKSESDYDGGDDKD